MWSCTLPDIVQRMRYMSGQGMVFIAAGKALHSVPVGVPGVSDCGKEAKPRQVAHLSDHARDFCVGKRVSIYAHAGRAAGG